MRKFLLLTITILAAACGGDGINGPGTTGADGAFQLSEAFCVRSVECGFRVDAQIPACIDDNIGELCQGYIDCDAELSAAEQDAFDQCALDLSVRSCNAGLSSACAELLGL